jgi:serine/threonine kinase 32
MKPDNLLLDSQGHIYITDFNCSLSLKERIPNAKAGTLEYMAPEMFTGNSYYFSVDWWSLGVILFQCAFHKV